MRHGRRARRAAIRTALTATAAAAAFAATANASTLGIGVGTPTPEQGLPVPLTFSGATLGAGGGYASLDAVVRPAGGPACQATYSADRAATGGVGEPLVATEVAAGAPYSRAATWTPPSVGAFVICAWLFERGHGGRAQETGPIATTVTTRGPQVAVFSVGLPAPAVRGHAFTVRYTTQTDQSLYLKSVLKPAGASGCAASFDLERAGGGPDQLLATGIHVSGGPAVRSVRLTEPAGDYLICSWISGPSAGEVDAALTTPLSVGQPPPQPVPAAPAIAITSLTASASSAIAVAGTTAHGLTGRLTLTALCYGHLAHGTATAAGGTFSGRLPLPTRCGAGNRVVATVAWAGSTAFARGTARSSVTVARPAGHRRRRGPTLFSGSRQRHGRVRNVFAVRPRHVSLDPAHGGRLAIRWSRWSARSARGVGTGHGHGRGESFPVQVTASHPIRGTFACLRIVDYRRGRREVARMGLGRIFGRTFTWLPVRYLHRRRSGATPWPRPGCPA